MQLLQTAGVDFAILGTEETCTVIRASWRQRVPLPDQGRGQRRDPNGYGVDKKVVSRPARTASTR
ncbi:MAG: hypothetical protein R3B99_13195 [Polyangiales bacterium]